MSELTLGGLQASLALIASIITALGVIGGVVAFVAKKWLTSALKPLESKIDDLGEAIDEVGLSDCKNFIVNALETIERGDTLSEIAKERFEENYKIYTEKFKRNGYVRARVEEYRQNGKL